MGGWFSSKITVEQYCHQQPNWFKMVVEIDSVDKWKGMLQAILADGECHRGRVEVLHQFYHDVLFNLCECRKNRETAVHICMAYDQWLWKHPQWIPKNHNLTFPLTPLFTSSS